MKIVVALLFYFSLLTVSSSFAQSNPYIDDGAIGTVKKKPSTVAVEDGFKFPFYSVEQWIGKKFMFLPKSKSLQRYGYMIGRKTLSYEDYVGKIATIKEVNTKDYLPIVSFYIEETDDDFDATMYGSSIDAFCLVDDLDSARSRYMGKTLWYKGTQLVSFDPTTEKFSHVDVKKLVPVKVEKVIAAWYNHSPIRFVISNSNGDMGFVDLNLSGTNTGDILKHSSLFDDYFFEEDPHKLYNWSDKVWNAISDEKVFVGMTKQQVRLSWGKPKDINRSTSSNGSSEQWVYATGSYLYFTGDVLESIQN